MLPNQSTMELSRQYRYDIEFLFINKKHIKVKSLSVSYWYSISLCCCLLSKHSSIFFHLHFFRLLGAFSSIFLFRFSILLFFVRLIRVVDKNSYSHISLSTHHHLNLPEGYPQFFPSLNIHFIFYPHRILLFPKYII